MPIDTETPDPTKKNQASSKSDEQQDDTAGQVLPFDSKRTDALLHQRKNERLKKIQDAFARALPLNKTKQESKARKKRKNKPPKKKR